jgi:hypothetical protein
VDEWDIYQTDEVAAGLQELQDSDPKTADPVRLRPVAIGDLARCRR